jgi:hypothetical protein
MWGFVDLDFPRLLLHAEYRLCSGIDLPDNCVVLILDSQFYVSTQMESESLLLKSKKI